MTDVSDSGHLTARKVVHGRLAYYQTRPSVDYWDRFWARENIKKNMTSTNPGGWQYIEQHCLKYLPKNGIVLEAGCGPGYILNAMVTRGYQAEGIEWAPNTVNRVKCVMPELPIRQGDVRQIDTPDGFYSAYVSIGVVEHNIDGPEVFLKEAHRVIRNDGIALISVPHFHILRRINVLLRAYRKPKKNEEFYQYAFRPNDFAKCLVNEGFNILEIHGYDSIKGLFDESRFFRFILKLPWLRHRACRYVATSKVMKRLFGHMILFIVQNPNR